MEQLMDKLIKAKAIMNKSDEIKRGGQTFPQTSDIQIQNFDAPNAKFNIPSEYIQEQSSTVVNKTPKTQSVEAIKNSKLPDEIKKLMIERPIVQPQQSGPTLTNELVEKASRLMRENTNNSPITTNQKSTQNQTSFDYQILKKIVKEVVEESLRENGLISESTEKANETFSFKVGKHLFEGKVTKIKKLS
jgi:hypothetical protein